MFVFAWTIYNKCKKIKKSEIGRKLIMLKKIKKVICVTLSLVMLFTLNSSAFAAEKSATTIKYEERVFFESKISFMYTLQC